MNLKFWAGKRVFLTGHTGFKGSWLSLWLQHLKAEVFGYSLAPPTHPSLFELATVSEEMDSTIGDIRDLPALQMTLNRARPEIVIHFAAQSLVRRSYEEPIETYSTNVMGTVNLLEAVRRCESVKAVIVVTSDKCYENREWPWGYRENDPMGGDEPYSSSKGCAELVTNAYRRAFFNTDLRGEARVAVASARAGNVIGGGDWAIDRLIPDIMNAIFKGAPVVIRNPRSIRPWQYVLDPLRGYLTLAERLYQEGGRFATSWNFGPAEFDICPVSRIVNELTTRWGGGASWRLDESTHPHEAISLKLDCSRARWELGWTPRVDLSKALEWIILWYRGFRQGVPARALVQADIERYESLIALYEPVSL